MPEALGQTAWDEMACSLEDLKDEIDYLKEVRAYNLICVSESDLLDHSTHSFFRYKSGASNQY